MPPSSGSFSKLYNYERNVFHNGPFFAMQVLHSLLIFFFLTSKCCSWCT